MLYCVLFMAKRRGGRGASLERYNARSCGGNRMIREDLSKMNPAPLGRKSLRFAIGISTLLAVGVFSVAYLAPVALPAAREPANVKKCQKQLRAIGQAMMLYANENSGSFPRDLGQVLTTQDLTSSIFICPSSKDEPASGANLQAR